jgi:hypothetical protein
MRARAGSPMAAAILENRGVSVEFDIHTFTVDELFVPVNWQSTECVRCGGRLVEYFLPNLS